MRTPAAAAVDLLVDDKTYTFATLERMGGVDLANRARELAGVPVRSVPRRPRAPRAGGSSTKVPRRADGAGRLGDRLAGS